LKACKTEFKNAQKAKEFLAKENLLDNDYQIEKDANYIYFPIKADKLKKYEVVERDFKRFEKKENLKEYLADKLTAAEMEKLKTSHDIIGNIAILEVDRELEKKEKLIAKHLLNKNITTVLKKSGEHAGVFRTQKMTFLVGKNTKETIHKESKALIKLDVETVYFSPRLSTERKRIAEQVKFGETVLVMFSGCAPYPLVIAKNSLAGKIIGIEINPTAHKYGLENVKLNKLKNIELIQGDVKEIMPKLNMKFDRILMPLPKSAEDYLEIALTAAKKGSVIHFYDFLNEKDIPKAAIEKIENACKKAGYKHKVLDWVKCGQHSPRTFRICVDFKRV
jgi:tRNA (guanine37-N1)-methyltransferase